MNLLRQFLLLSILSLLTSCSDTRPTLHLYTWADFFAPGVIEEFEEEFQCRVVVDTFGGNAAMFSKLSLGASGYDLVTPTDYYAGMLHAANLLQELDHGQIPNRSGLAQGYLQNLASDPDTVYSIPYLVGAVGLAYRKDLLPELNPSWSALFDENARGRITLLNGERAVIGAALLSMGEELNSRDPAAIERAGKRVREWQERAATLDNEMFRSGLASGEFLLAMAFSGDTLSLKGEFPEIEFMLPEEGFPVISDVWVIPAGARRPELAHALINFMLRPEIARRNSEYTFYGSPLDAVQDLAHGTPIRFLGEAEGLYRKEWEALRRRN